MSKNKRRGVPSKISKQYQVPPVVPEKMFNAGRLIFNFLVMTRLQHEFGKKNHPLELYFDGIMRGYEDWFEALAITQDDFDRVQTKMDKREIMNEVERLYPIFLKQWEDRLKQNEPLVVLPGVDPKRARMAMDMFDRKLERSKK
jgi:hypothetical protein